MKYMFLCLLLLGCSDVVEIVAPNGNTGFSFFCENEKDCIKKSKDLCPNGYSVLSKTRHSEYITNAKIVCDNNSVDWGNLSK